MDPGPGRAPRVPAGRRDAFIEHLAARGVDAGIHFVPVHRHTHFADAPRAPLPVTERAVDQVVTLPLHSLMPERSIERVIDGVVSFFS